MITISLPSVENRSSDPKKKEKSKFKNTIII